MSDTFRWSGAALAALLAVWALFKLRVYLDVGAGYKAKTLATALFGSGRDLDPQRAPQIHDDSYWLLRPFRVHVDREPTSTPPRSTRKTRKPNGVPTTSGSRQVTTALFGLHPRTAVHRPGYGATLQPFAGPLAPVPAPPAVVHAGRDWPEVPGPAALQRFVDDTFTEPNPRRLRRTYAVLVVHDGRIVAERYAPGITASMPLPGWSMAKSVLSALIGLLVRDGHLALDSRELLPAWTGSDPRAAITLEDLLRMRSGLHFSEVYANPWSDVLHMLYRSGDMGGYAASRPLAHRVGSVWSYASGTSNILSLIARRALGDAAYHALPRTRLFDPLGMSSAVMEPDASGTFVCSSYMLATARDWARYGQLWMDGGRVNGTALLPESWVRFSTVPTPESQGRYGAHWWRKLNPDIGGDTEAASRIAPDAFFAVGHEGQTLSVIPSKKLVVVRLGASIHIDAWNQAAFIAGIQDIVG